jgi:hypothetical protein
VRTAVQRAPDWPRQAAGGSEKLALLACYREGINAHLTAAIAMAVVPNFGTLRNIAERLSAFVRRVGDGLRVRGARCLRREAPRGRVVSRAAALSGDMGRLMGSEESVANLTRGDASHRQCGGRAAGEGRRGRFSQSVGGGGAAVADGEQRRGVIGAGRYERSGGAGSLERSIDSKGSKKPEEAA